MSSTFVLAVYLILVGAMGLVETRIPGWVPAALAFVAGLLLLFLGWRETARRA